jgi:hypothetical protein
MPLPSNVSFLGVAKESSKGTAAAATVLIPVREIKPQDVVQYLDDTNYRGSMVDTYGEVAGPAYSTLDVSGDVFPDTIGWWLAGMMGDVTTTGASAPYSHVMGVKNSGDGQPGSKTFVDFFGISQARAYAGGQVAELAFKISGEGLFEYSAKVTALPSALVTKPTLTATALPPYPGWQNTISIAGASKTYLEAAEINFKRAATPQHTADGTQAPYGIWVGPLAVDGKFTFIAEDETEFTRYLTNTQPAVILDSTTGAGASLTEVKFVMTKCAYTVAELNRSKDYVTYDVTFKAIANTTDVGASGGYGQCKVTLQNAVAASVYV